MQTLANKSAAGLVWLIVLLLGAVGCGGAGPAAEATPLPQGMAFDDAARVYDIVPEETEARFLIGEILRGEPKTVVGKTNQVSGQIFVAAGSALDHETTPTYRLTVRASDGELADSAIITVEVTDEYEAPYVFGDTLYVGWTTEKLISNIYDKIEELRGIVRTNPRDRNFRKGVRLINIRKLMILLVKHIHS